MSDFPTIQQKAVANLESVDELRVHELKECLDQLGITYTNKIKKEELSKMLKDALRAENRSPEEEEAAAAAAATKIQTIGRGYLAVEKLKRLRTASAEVYVQRRTNNPWTPEETAMLRAGYKRYGSTSHTWANVTILNGLLS
jgi:hypothetical protein